MFIAQVNSYLPGGLGGNSTTILSPKGSIVLFPKAGNTTRSEHEAVSSRRNVIRIGSPARAYTTFGL